MEHEYDVSVIVCYYNAEKYVIGCIDSVIEQTEQSVQLIMVDDGSSDNGLTIVREIAKNYDNIVVVTKQNTGLGSSRNTGLEYASGKYVYFLDVDDFLDSRALTTLYKLAEENNAEIVYCASLNVREEMQNVSSIEAIPEDQRLGGLYVNRSVSGVYGGKEYVLRSLESEEGFFPPVWLGLFRRSFLLDNKLMFENIIHEDNIWSMDVALCAHRIVVIPDVLHYRRIVSTSITNQAKSARHVAGAMRVLERAIEVSAQESVDSRSRVAFHTWTLMSAGLVYEELMATSKDVRKQFKPQYIDILKSNSNMFNNRLIIKSLIRI